MRLLFALFVLGALFAMPAFALELNYPDIPGFGDLNDVVQGSVGFPQVAQFLFAAALWVGVLIAFAVLVWAGWQFALSAGNPGKRREVQDRLAGIVLGILMLLSVYIILRAINPDLVFLQTRSFVICQPLGPLDCANPSSPALEGDSGGGTSPPPPFSLKLYDNINKSLVLSTTDNDLTDNPHPSGGSWNDRGYLADVIGFGTVTFYEHINFNEGVPAGGWIRIIRIDPFNPNAYSCENKKRNTDAIEDCTAIIRDSLIPNTNTLLNVDLPSLVIESRFFNDRWEDDISSIRIGGPGDGTAPPPTPSPAPTNKFALNLNYPDIPGFGDLDVLVGAGPLSFPHIIRLIYAAALWLAGTVALAGMFYAGFVFAVSSGNPAKHREAQGRLAGVALGLLILFSAFLILRTINPDLTQFSLRTFAICEPQGTVKCPMVSLPELTEAPSPSLPAIPPFKLFLAKNLIVGPPIFFSPEDVLEVSGDINLSAEWDNKAHYIRMEGSGKALFFDAPNYSQTPPPWLELAHHDSLGYTCVDGQLKSGAPIDIGSCTSFFNSAGNQITALNGVFVDLGKFCIDNSCPFIGGDRFEDNVSSISFTEASRDIPSGCPVAGCGTLSNFAGHVETRCGPDYGDPNYINCGVDVQSSEGEGGEVYATMSGTASVGWYDMGGNVVNIYNSDGTIFVYYSHLLDFAVPSGSTVSRGQLIGHQDRTGNAKTLPIESSHVHYGVVVNGVGVDPELYSLK